MTDELDLLEDTPEAFGVPHPAWRGAQKEAFLKATDMIAKKEKFAIAELPTGSGKSGVATALGHDRRVLVLTHTLGLLDQYAEAYGFSVVKGMASYPCVLPKKVQQWKRKYDRVPLVSDCHFTDMRECPVYESCKYIVARDKAMAARRSACTYRYAALSRGMQVRSGVVVLDEAHGAADEIVAMDSIQITEYERRDLDLPPFPFNYDYGARDRNGDRRGGLVDKVAQGKLVEWLGAVKAITSVIHTDWDPDEQRAKKSMHAKASRALDGLAHSEWFLEAGPNAIEYSRKQRGRWTSTRIPGIRLRPLSARETVGRLWHDKDFAFLMSATIGNPAPLAYELGIDKYEFISFSHPIPAEYRPVYNLGVPRMTWGELKKNPGLYIAQGAAIHKFIRKLPEDWRGLILTSSYLKIGKLIDYLKPRLNGRVFINGNNASDMEKFLASPEPGLVAVQTMQGWSQGLDLYGDKGRFVIVAGVPFSNPDDPYEQARQKRPGGAAYYWWSVYTSIPQACGRVSRGERDEDGNWLINVAAIADGSALTYNARKQFPAWFKEALR